MQGSKPEAYTSSVPRGVSHCELTPPSSQGCSMTDNRYVAKTITEAENTLTRRQQESATSEVLGELGELAHMRTSSLRPRGHDMAVQTEESIGIASGSSGSFLSGEADPEETSSQASTRFSTIALCEQVRVRRRWTRLMAKEGMRVEQFTTNSKQLTVKIEELTANNAQLEFEIRSLENEVANNQEAFAKIMMIHEKSLWQRGRPWDRHMTISGRTRRLSRPRHGFAINT
jgi:hypothetical protein